MTTASLRLAANGSGMASAAALALWRSLVGWDGGGDPGQAVEARERVEAKYAVTALDLIAAHVGTGRDIPDGVLRESVARAALYLSNTEGPDGYGPGIRELHGPLDTRIVHAQPGSVLRRSGVMALLAPWKRRRARAI